jgi:hypothetical protein
MNADTDDRITTQEPGQEPTAKQLIDEIREAILSASARDVWTKLTFCHQTRRCLWEGKPECHDGRLTEDESTEQVWRWKGAPNISVPLCDKIVRWLMLMRAEVVNSGDVRIGPRRAAVPEQGEDLSQTWQDTLDYFIDVQESHLSYQSELFGVCVEEFGYGVQLVEVEKKFRNELRKMDLQTITDALVEQRQNELLAAAQDAAGDMPVDPALVLTADAQQRIATEVQTTLEMMLAMGGKPTPDHLALITAADSRISDKEAAKVLQQLREEPDEQAEYTAPKDDGCLFKLKTLVPWVNCIHPGTLTGEGKTDMIAEVCYLNETQLREKALAEEWEKTALEEMITNQKNRFFTELNLGVDLPGWGLNGMGIGLTVSSDGLTKFPHWLVIYVYRKVTNKKGLPMVYRGALNPHMEEMLFWEMTDLKELPIVVDTSEPVRFAMDARGVGQVIADKQNFVKDSLDNEGARSQLGSNPPFMRTNNTHVGIKPGKEMFGGRSGQSYVGSQFLQVPNVDQGTLNLMDRIEKQVDDYYFRSATTDPEDKRAFRKWKMMRAKRCYSEQLRLIWEQMHERIDALQVSMINGRPVQLDTNRDQLRGEASISIGVHLDGLSEDAADKFVKVLVQLMQADRGGVIDWAEGTQIAAQLLSPTFARRLVMTSQAAAGKIKDDQETRIAKIMAGVPLDYPEKPSNPQMRMQVLQQWAQKPTNVARASADPVVAELMQKEQEYLQFAIQQMSNAVTGRTGVEANAPEGQ